MLTVPDITSYDPGNYLVLDFLSGSVLLSMESHTAALACYYNLSTAYNF